MSEHKEYVVRAKLIYRASDRAAAKRDMQELLSDIENAKLKRLKVKPKKVKTKDLDIDDERAK